MRWIVSEAKADAARKLASALNVHALTAQVLVARGMESPEAAEAFLKDALADLPNPFTMKGMEGAVERISRALKAGEKITLYGDYDVDGVCSTALLSLFLEACGGVVSTYIPHRMDEGYGLNLAAVERIAKDGTRVLVTLDCGITSVTEVTRAKALGLDVVIVDHHAVPETLPPADAVLNPHQPGCGYPTRHLCAAGVAFNLCMALRKALREAGAFQTRPEPNLSALLDLVALATVADVVPLTGANRVLVRHGLLALGRAERLGVRALKEVAGLGLDAPVSAGQVGFRLGPRINAAGRLDDASLGLKLLRTRDANEARALAKELDHANAERQGIEKDILEAALAQAAEKAAHSRGFVLHAEGWHAGVIGIVASRVVERFHRPTVMVAVKDGVGKGSARSIEGFHLYEALAACQGHLIRFGGHKHAAGLTVAAERLKDFESAFANHAGTFLRDEDLQPRCKVDAVVSPAELTEKAVVALERLAPFGAGNPEPVLALRRQAVRPRVLQAKDGRGGHLKLALEGEQRLSAIGFHMADRLALTEGHVDLAFNAGLDTWNGQTRLELKLKDLRTAV